MSYREDRCDTVMFLLLNLVKAPCDFMGKISRLLQSKSIPSLFTCLSFCLYLYINYMLAACLPVVNISPFLYLSLSLCLSLSLSVSLSLSPSLSIHLSSCLSIHLYLIIPLYIYLTFLFILSDFCQPVCISINVFIY